ncbi:MAG: hypothetical protein BroJett040_16720 [Oligoflexia bacterium]|nr:MAG: hypothetical protein BroJett040_16720 [Oligoflexia bacterium]
MQKKSRLKHRYEVDGEGSWAISYGDMVTLLLTFFIMFFAADKFQDKKNLKIEIVSSAFKQDRTIASEKKSSKHPNEPLSENLSGKVYQIGPRLFVEFPGISFFNSGSLELTKDGSKALKSFYEKYRPYTGKYNISIRAFTDVKKVRQKSNPRFKDNLELSALRSITVMRELQHIGIPLGRMKLGGYGELVMTLDDLQKLPESQRKPTSVLDMARTVVLIIEPGEAKNEK